MTMSTLEKSVIEAISKIGPALEDLAIDIGANPELGYEEVFAVQRILSLLKHHGHSPSRVENLDTAFIAKSGHAGKTIAILAEYDALPGLGHACGHNVIAGAAVGAFLGLAAVDNTNTYKLIGCPAEESTVDAAGGKIRLIEAGIFDSVNSAMMIHPYHKSGIVTQGALAAAGYEYSFRGTGAHAAMAPADGRNALDAAIQTYSSISMLRQQLPSHFRVHGIITDGGDSPNIIPDRASLRFRLRARNMREMQELVRRANNCAEGAALATQTTLNIQEFMPVYEPMRQDPSLTNIADTVLRDLQLNTDATGLSFGSSDFGNVSQIVPSIEIGIGLPSGEHGPHTEEFRDAALSTAGVKRTVVGAQALALTALRYVASSTVESRPRPYLL